MPDSAKQSPPSPAVQEQALEWLVLLQSEPADERTKQRFRDWLHANPAHGAAWSEAAGFWRALDQLPSRDAEELRRMVEPTPSPRQLEREGKSSGQRSSMLPWAMAALLLLTAGWRMMTDPAWRTEETTTVGEQREVALSDGSTVTLNTNSALSFDITPERRRLTLFRGEAYFSVAPDARRPFEVETPFGVVTALGTAFDVRIDDNGAAITVHRHAVALRDLSGTAAVRLEQGHRMRIDPQGLGHEQPADLIAELAWRQRQLIVRDRPLHEVATELNRYRRGHIIVLGAHAQSLAMTGMLDLRDPDRALQSLVESLPVKATRLPLHWVILQSATD